MHLILMKYGNIRGQRSTDPRILSDLTFAFVSPPIRITNLAVPGTSKDIPSLMSDKNIVKATKNELVFMPHSLPNYSCFYFCKCTHSHTPMRPHTKKVSANASPAERKAAFTMNKCSLTMTGQVAKYSTGSDLIELQLTCGEWRI